ncbi:Histidine kinase [Aspergillus nanangensis]|uniref:histidine kinase n=1 Tax=Aspergillus nanangensis TaxID=2582783 RepID=A0AAD4CDN1_ASPNN|nr:Histidine kinase [Aspergillus nanangensis]
MRVPIALQFALLVLLTAVVGVVVLSIATWTTTYNFVVDVESQGLELVATIKASQIASSLELLAVNCKTISTRLLIQGALRRYYQGNTSSANWATATTDIQSALGTRGYLSTYQAIIYSKNGHQGPVNLLEVTSDTIPQIVLPYTDANGSSIMLGGDEYPPILFPNLTYTQVPRPNNPIQVNASEDYELGPASSLLLGPVVINGSFSLISLTLPIVNNTSDTDILGYMTVVASGESLQRAVTSRDGMGNTGQVLLLGPSRPDNRFSTKAQPATATSASNRSALAESQVHYIFEPTAIPNQSNKGSRALTRTSFSLTRYSMALDAMLQSYEKENNSISSLSAQNEQGASVAVGVMRPKSSLVQWILLVEKSHSEAFAPVTRLRKIILACVFGTVGLIIIMVPLLAHWAVAPIRRLREAARKSIQPDLGPVPSAGDDEKRSRKDDNGHATETTVIVEHCDKASDRSWVKYLRRPLQRFDSTFTVPRQRGPKASHIPGRVRERKHWVTDELTELTSTFNEMTDMLTIQYSRLEERVIERTRELEKAKLAAEAANESKTLFIANISHELKTPLNGILGMCAVCMGEDNLDRIKKSLQVVYKSGDLLLHLLNDLLTFSKNQIEQAIQLEEKEFQISEIRSQLIFLFQNQVNEKNIDFTVKFVPGLSSQHHGTVCRDRGADHEPSVSGPASAARVKHMVLFGDQHRILQILINLVSNSLKFTPENGKVEVRIRCIEESAARPEGFVVIGNKSSPHSVVLPGTSSRRRSEALENAENDWQPSAFPRPQTLIFQFEVEDNGPGIPANLQRRVFDPFVQGDLGLNRKYGGTGLGLSICAQLSKLMGGLILLDSEEGKGALFTVKLPLQFIKEAAPSTHSSSLNGSRTPSVLSLEDFSSIARTSSDHESMRGETRVATDMQPRLVGLSQPFFAAGTLDSSPSPSSQKIPDVPKKAKSEKRIRVLVAEDNKVNQQVVLRMLALEDVYDVTVVKDGQEAYDSVRANMEEGKAFDLIFMDIQMPNLDGIQSTRLIRQIGYSAPIVALTAFAEDSNIKNCMESGMDMFISKPIRRPALKQVLDRFASIPEECEITS